MPSVRHGIQALLLLLVLGATGCARFWGFSQRAYYEPLAAGIRDANISALAYGKSSRFAYLTEPDDPRQIWDIDLGYEMPLFGYESQDHLSGRMPAGAFGIGLWLPIDFHMAEDFVDESNPIINTDYRFGAMLKAQYGLRNRRWVSARAHFGHESTHLGDEYSLAAPRAFPTTFERINVSWEYLDVGLQYEGSHWSGKLFVRGGITSTLPFGDSYYSVDDESAPESAQGPVIESHNSVDPYIGTEYVSTGLFWPERWNWYASAELRHRSIYDYHRASAAVAEDRQASLNLILGAQKQGGFGTTRVSPFVRYYRGVNPHGQFRNEADYQLWGIGLRLRTQ